jgi:hypothetical protein
MTVAAAVVPRLLVPPPPGPVAHRFGLFSAATILENPEPHALTGIEYVSVCSTQVDPYPVWCEPTVPDGTSTTKVPRQTIGTTEASPFAVYAADECVLGRDQDEAKQQLRQRFLAGEQAAVERIVWNGVLGNWPTFAAAEVLSGGTAGVDLIDGIGLLEQWLAETWGGVGVIHGPRTIAPRAAQSLAVTINGPRALTIFGSVFAFGTGYPGTPPDTGGTDDGSLWIYATPPITIRRSPLIEPADWTTNAFDRSTNRGMLIDERLYVVDWPCGVAAVQINTASGLKRPGYIQPTGTSAPEE